MLKSTVNGDIEYMQKFRNEYKEKKVLAVGIFYNSKTKEHSCKIEEILK